MPDATPTLRGIVESFLFVTDLDRAAAFYEKVLGLRKLRGPDARGCVFAVTDRQVLGLVRQGAAREPTVTPGGVIPPCDASGSMHLAFGIEASELEAWHERLEGHGLEVSPVDWETGARSLYVRDPDGHLIELLTDVAGLWGL